MTLARKRALTKLVALTMVFSMLAPSAAQDTSGAPTTLSDAQLEQLAAPIALYPDALLAQVLMASTYPLEVVEAARWAKANPKVTGKALESALQQQTWDASVKSLAAFPQVLEMMDQKLDWTTQLGDAFLAQQKDVMNAVQVLRAKAEAAGNLKSNEQQKVVVKQEPAGDQPQTIIIEPASPQVVYVPTYNPTVVYGAWPYPAYPPYYYYPPGYVAATSMISFGVGMAVGSALWGGCNWGSSNVNVNVNNYNSFNKTNISNNQWQHNSVHRKGVQYRDSGVRQKYGQSSPRNAQSREAFRGRAEQGRKEIAKGGAGALGGTDRGGRSAGSVADRGKGQRSASTHRSDLAGSSGRRDAGAFKGMGNGGEVRRQSQRGQTSRQSSLGSHGGRSGGGSAGGRGGGGGGGGGRGRGGGGGRGGGRR